MPHSLGFIQRFVKWLDQRLLKFVDLPAESTIMILARVLGNIVATQKNERYESASVMLCQQISPEGDPTATTVLALNAVDAGVGDTVLIVQEGWSASTAATGKSGAAIDSAIVGVVDRIDLLDDSPRDSQNA